MCCCLYWEKLGKIAKTMRNKHLLTKLLISILLAGLFSGFAMATQKTETGLQVVEVGMYGEFIVPDRVQVYLKFDLTNSGETALEAEKGETPFLVFPLPDEALSVGFLPTDAILEPGYGNPFLKTEDGFADPRPLLPGETRTVTYTFELSYPGEIKLELPLKYRVNSITFLENPGQEITYHLSQNEKSDGTTTLDLWIKGENPFSSGGVIKSASLPELLLGGIVVAAAVVILYGWYGKKKVK